MKGKLTTSGNLNECGGSKIPPSLGYWKKTSSVNIAEINFEENRSASFGVDVAHCDSFLGCRWHEGEFDPPFAVSLVHFFEDRRKFPTCVLMAYKSKHPYNKIWIHQGIQALWVDTHLPCHGILFFLSGLHLHQNIAQRTCRSKQTVDVEISVEIFAGGIPLTAVELNVWRSCI